MDYNIFIDYLIQLGYEKVHRNTNAVSYVLYNHKGYADSYVHLWSDNINAFDIMFSRWTRDNLVRLSDIVNILDLVGIIDELDRLFYTPLHSGQINHDFVSSYYLNRRVELIRDYRLGLVIN